MSLAVIFVTVSVIELLVLAAVIVPLAIVTVRRAWRGELTRHRAVARWTLPLWLYVSINL